MIAAGQTVGHHDELLALALSTSIAARAAEASSYKSESKTVVETFTSNITRVFAANDGEYRFVAYAVQWRDQEVIVLSYGPRTDDFRMGDAIRCEMRQMPAPSISTTNGPRITFNLMGRAAERTTGAGSSSSNGDEAARVKAITAEIERRRLERESARQ